VRESAQSEATGLRFTLSGAIGAYQSLALAEPIQGDPVLLYVAFFDANHQIVADPVLEWSGLIDQMTVVDDGQSSIIRITAENELFDFARQGSSAQPQTPVGFGGGGPRGGGRFQQVQVDPSFYFYDLNAKLTYRPSSKDVATISVFRGLDNLDQSQTLGGGFARFNPGGAAAPTAGATPTLNDLTIAQNTGVSARWFRQWSSRLSSDLIASNSEYLSDGNRTASGGLPNGGARFDFGFTETNTVEDRTVRLENVVELAASSRLEFGVWATRNTVTYLCAVGSTTLTICSARGETSIRVICVAPGTDNSSAKRSRPPALRIIRPNSANSPA
jgi:hypothetical protein